MCQDEVSIVVAGPSGSGKTELVLKILKNLHENVIWFYGAEPPDTKLKMQCKKGLPVYEELPCGPATIVIDDLMSETNEDVTKLFTKGRSHKCLNVIYITQNIFDKKIRCINLNTQLFYLFKNIRDKLQIQCFAKQMYPKEIDYFLKAYEDATSVPFGSLRVDCRPATSDEHRLITFVNGGENPLAYIIKKDKNDSKSKISESSKNHSKEERKKKSSK